MTTFIDISELKFQQVIGQGKTSQVSTACIKGSCSEESLIVAVKQFKTYPSALEDLAREVDALSELIHPNILKMLGKDSNKIVMEYHSQGDLFNLVSRSKLPEPIARFLFGQLLSAVTYMHEHNWAHRDIKLENILINKDQQIILADLGFATKSEEGQTCDIQMGTLGYMAPELQARQQYCAKKVDVFALGVVLFSMVNGFPPFFRATSSDPYYKFFIDGRQQIYWVKLGLKFHITNSLSPSFKNLIEKMLVADSSQRITVQEILNHPWMNDSSESVQSQEVSEFLMNALDES